MVEQVVILAGGEGRRLKGLSQGIPKPLLDVAGEPFVAGLINELARFGFRDFLLLVGPFQIPFQSLLPGKIHPEVNLQFVSEPCPAGTAGALSYARDFLQPEFLLVNGDSFFDFNYLDLALNLPREKWLMKLALRFVDDTNRYGAVILDDTKVAGFLEKSRVGSGFINGGVYLMKREILEEVRDLPCSLENDVLPRLVERSVVFGKEYKGNFIDIGTPEDFHRSQSVLRDWRRRPAVFFDRDGVLNQDTGYVYTKEKFSWLGGSREAIHYLNGLGYLVFVVTNQAGIARGYYEIDDVICLHDWINQELKLSGAHVDKFYFCPHHPSAGQGSFTRSCACRKPEPGMILSAFQEWDIDKRKSFLIGDKNSDVEAAGRAGIKGHFFKGGDLYSFVRDVVESLN